MPPIPIPNEPVNIVKPKSHGFLLVLTVLLFLTGAFADYYFLKLVPDPEIEIIPVATISKSDQFSDWKTYTNTKYGYELKYPSDKISISEGEIPVLPVVNPSAPSEDPIVQVLNFYLVPHGSDRDGMLKVRQGTSINGMLPKVTINNISWGKLSNPNSTGVSYITVNSGFSYGFDLDEKLQPEQILSTFKFIEKDKTNQTMKSGVRGVVTIGPTCPVMREPPDPQCADKTFEASLMIKNQLGKIMLQSKTNKDGTFKFDLAPGKYTIENASTGVMPSLSPVSVTVNQNTYSEINLQFDSGIR